MLEITESAVISDPLRTEAVLARLAKMGVRLSVDDFGTGYSSLTYLTRPPIDEIKIDRSFVTNMNISADKEVIVRSTIDLAATSASRLWRKASRQPSSCSGWKSSAATRCRVIT